MSEICAAARRLEGGRLSLHWDDSEAEITFVRDKGWFWTLYDRKLKRTRMSGRAATIEAAVEQAMDAVRLPVAAE